MAKSRIQTLQNQVRILKEQRGGMTLVCVKLAFFEKYEFK